MIVNTAGGVTGGDRSDLDIAVGADAELTVTTTAAEKVYRSLGPDAVVGVTIEVAAAGRLTWLPQETILFDGARLKRSIEVDLAEDASLLMAEAVVFGRQAMGEAVVHGSFIDHWRVRRGGRLIFAETLRLDGAIAERLGEAAVARGGVAIANVLLAPGDDAAVERVRALDQFCGEVGISSWNGLAVARLCAKDGAALRRDLVAVLGALGQAIPRSWLH